MLYFTIVRHGQTQYDVAKIIHSHTDGEMTAVGLETATALGHHLKDEKFTRIYSSDLIRCKQTTENFMWQLRSLPPKITYTPILRERHCGDWEFHSHDVIRQKIQELNLPPDKYYLVNPPNGETYEECKSRAGRFLSEICDIADETDDSIVENVIAFSHRDIILCLLEYLLEHPAMFQLKNFDYRFSERHLKNTSRTCFTISKLRGGNTQRLLTFTRLFDIEHLGYLVPNGGTSTTTTHA